MNCSRHTSVSFGCSLAALLTCGILVTVAASAHVATSCETLKATPLPHTTITAADTVAQGAFTGASARGYDYKTLSRLLPRPGRDCADERFTYRVRSVDASQRLERQVPRYRQRRVRRRDHLLPAGRCIERRIRDRVHRYRSQRQAAPTRSGRSVTRRRLSITATGRSMRQRTAPKRWSARFTANRRSTLISPDAPTAGGRH